MNLKRYPYLVDPWSYASLKLGSGVSFEVLAGDEHLVSLALTRLKYCLDGRLPDEISASTEDEVFSFWLLLLALKATGSIYVFDRVLDAEFDRIARFLRGEGVDNLILIAGALGIRVERRTISFPWVKERDGRVIHRTLDLAIPVADFLRYASKSKAEELRLANNFVKGGYVYLDRERLVKLLSEASRIFLVEKLKTVEIPESKAFQRLVEEVRRLEAMEATGFREELLPDCIRSIVASSKARRLSDEEIYVLLSFLSSIGAPREYVERLLVETGLAGGEEARVVAESLSRIRGYTPFKCEELRSRGICDCLEDLVREYRARVRTQQARRRS